MKCIRFGCDRKARRWSPLCREHFEALVYGHVRRPAR
jgi:hypothetical protein